jgi:NhaP-type Na+/H+ or K+/H+ antiporter
MFISFTFKSLLIEFLIALTLGISIGSLLTYKITKRIRRKNKND